MRLDHAPTASFTSTKGQLVETGSPEELMAKPDGVYKRFVDLHLGESAA